MSNKKTLVLGASTNPERYSYRAILSLLSHGHDVRAVGLRPGNVGECKIVNEQIDFDNIDTITVYVSPDNQPVYYNYILKINPKRVILNPGTENPELEKKLTANNIPFEHACTLVLLASNQY
jgi:predicted CoA-binding protein